MVLLALAAIGAVQLGLATPTPSHALTTPTVMSVDDCSQAAQTVRTGVPKASLTAAYNTLLGCPASVAVPALVSAWGRIAGGEELGWRETASRRVSDRRILTASLQAGTTASRAVEERASGLSVAAFLILRGSAVSVTFWSHTTARYLDRIEDIAEVPGEQAITSADRAAALRSLDGMASTDADPFARSAASRLAAALRRSL